MDRTVKYVFVSGGQVIELSLIDKRDGKDIVCAPTQTSCRLGCRFCHLSGLDLPVKNLDAASLSATVRHVVDAEGLLTRDKPNPVLLVSFMGCGEPLLNLDGTLAAASAMRAEYGRDYRTVRFAVASLIPKLSAMREFTDRVRSAGLAVKFHWSLHTPDDGLRRELMPAARPIGPSLELVKRFVSLTGNAAEVHYALMMDVNDRDRDAEALIGLLAGTGISVKFLRYNEKEGAGLQQSSRVGHFRSALAGAGIENEYYEPPGADIGSSCGQFLLDYYERFAPPPGE
jgi:23S rRNA (adenine2503-C2)-methyltransferase